MPGPEQIDFTALARRAQQMRGAVTGAQQDLRAAETTAHSADGMVTATVNGESRVVGLRIDPSVIDPDDPEGLARTVMEAVDRALDAMAEYRTEIMSGVTGGLQSILENLHRDDSGPVVEPRFPRRRR